SFARSVARSFAIAADGDAIDELHDAVHFRADLVDVRRGADDRSAGARVCSQHAPYSLPVDGVDSGHGFVQEKSGRGVDGRDGDDEVTAHSAREAPGEIVGALGQAAPGERFLDPAGEDASGQTL